jgi:hypothetical protein
MNPKLLFYIQFIFTFILLENCNWNKEKITDIKIDTMLIDIGRIEIGKKKTAKFRIKNIGKNNLIISKIVPDCICTIPKWSIQPVFPDKYTVVEVQVDKDFEGIFQQVVTLICNSKEKKHLLVVRGNFVKCNLLY